MTQSNWTCGSRSTRGNVKFGECEAIGHPVKRLVRTRIGPLTDPRLPPGQWRTLERAEVRALEVASAGTNRNLLLSEEGER